MTGVILAGGRGERLGCRKALAKLNNQRLIEGVIDCLAPVTREIVIVTNREQIDLLKAAQMCENIVADIYPGKGALGGLYTGLANSDTFYNLVVACDMPFLNQALLRYLISICHGFDAVVPRTGEMLEPLHAVYSKDCMASIEQLWSQNKSRISELFNLVNVRYVDNDETDKFDPEHLSFFNINTQSGLRKARTLIKRWQRDITPAIRVEFCND